MGKLYEQIGEYKPDQLIASINFPIITGGCGLKPGQGCLSRGTLVTKTVEGNYIIAETVDESAKAYGILTDDVDTGTETSVDNIVTTRYLSGNFNQAAVIVKEGADIELFVDELVRFGIYLTKIQN